MNMTLSDFILFLNNDNKIMEKESGFISIYKNEIGDNEESVLVRYEVSKGSVNWNLSSFVGTRTQSLISQIESIFEKKELTKEVHSSIEFEEEIYEIIGISQVMGSFKKKYICENKSNGKGLLLNHNKEFIRYLEANDLIGYKSLVS